MNEYGALVGWYWAGEKSSSAFTETDSAPKSLFVGLSRTAKQSAFISCPTKYHHQ
jgi:hypothetical protein